MRQYLDLMQNILDKGQRHQNRTGTDTLSIFGTQTRYDLREGFPAMTTKKLFWSSVVKELLWMLRGESNTETLGCGIWDQWADEHGDLGPVYGAQWRDWIGYPVYVNHDQIANIIHRLQNNPDCRRIILSAWNVGELEEMALQPCHVMAQFRVYDGELSCQMYQRSADMFLGAPFNIASYALLTHMLAEVTGLKVGEFIHTIGDAHIYVNHIDQVKKQLAREPKPLPQLNIGIELPEDLKLDMESHAEFTLDGYNHHPAIRAPIAI